MKGLTHLARTRLRNPGTSMICALVALLLFCIKAVSAEFDELTVGESDGEYRLKVASVLDAPAHYVYHVITDYKHAYRINPAITEARVLPTGRDAVVRIMNRSEYRIGPFSLAIDWVGDISETALGTITVTTIPELSSFESGSASWKIRPQGKRTRVNYKASLKPRFFVPPFIGDYIVKNYMEREAVATFTRIECYARLKLDLDMENEPELRDVLLKEKNACNAPDGHRTSVAMEAQ